MSHPNPSLLARVNFPPYFVSALTERHILVAGGGGASKTGIGNSLEIYELEFDNQTKTVNADRVHHLDTGSTAFMNGTVFESESGGIYLAAGGIDGVLHVYEVTVGVTQDENVNGSIGSRRRSTSISKESKPVVASLPPTFPEDSEEVFMRRRRTSSTSSNRPSSPTTKVIPLAPLNDVQENGFHDNDHDHNKENGYLSNGQVHLNGQVNSNGNSVNHGSKHNHQQNGVQHHRQKSFDISSIPVPTLCFNVNPVTDIQVDFKKEIQQQQGMVKVEDSFVKAIVYSPVGNILLTGGGDGHLRIWSGFPHIKPNPLEDIPAHRDEIVDLDIDSHGQVIVTVCRVGVCSLWKRVNGSRIADLEFQPNNSKVKYKFKGCRFLPLEGERSRFLFTCNIPSQWTKPPLENYICRWDVKRFSMDKKVSVGVEPLAYMSISQDGRCIAAGSLTGSVSCFDTYSMQKLYQVDKCHSSFVTKVEFLSSCEETQVLTQSYQSAVSISVDNKIILHSIPASSSSGILTSPFKLVIFLVLVYLIATLTGL